MRLGARTAATPFGADTENDAGDLAFEDCAEASQAS